jgi:hypothetical protein
MKLHILIFFLLNISVTTCIDPFHLELEDYESLLTVEGMITDENASNTIKLTRTFQNEHTSPVLVTRAEVTVRDEIGVITVFHELEPGIYKSDSKQFTGRVGGTYTLHIKTGDGTEYASDECSMTAVTEIDSIYFEVESEFFDNGEVEEAGLRIYLDAENKEGACPYIRWEFEEVWKFRVPYPVFYEDLGYMEYKPVPVENDICWRYEWSKKILIHSSAERSSDRISREPIHFIASGRSNRLLKQYSILVRQYSISQQEFSFWKNLKEVTESGGDIFEKQPFPITGNISCINRENEKVLGYFKVSAVKDKRMYITKSQVEELDIPVYEYPCERIIYRTGQLRERIYEDLLNKGYLLFWVEESEFAGAPPINFQFTSADCSDCSLSGVPERPGFWVDMD